MTHLVSGDAAINFDTATKWSSFLYCSYLHSGHLGLNPARPMGSSFHIYIIDILQKYSARKHIHIFQNFNIFFVKFIVWVFYLFIYKLLRVLNMLGFFFMTDCFNSFCFSNQLLFSLAKSSPCFDSSADHPSPCVSVRAGWS